jgi:hypothetical protein
MNMKTARYPALMKDSLLGGADVKIELRVVSSVLDVPDTLTTVVTTSTVFVAGLLLAVVAAGTLAGTAPTAVAQ